MPASVPIGAGRADASTTRPAGGEISFHSGPDDRRHWARCGDGIVFLDIAADAYSCLYDPQKLRSNADDRPSDPTAPRLSGEESFLWRNLPLRPRPRTKLGDVRHVVTQLVIAAIRFRRRTFAQLVAPRTLDRGASGPSDAHDYATIIARFELLELFLPFRMQCLLRCFVLRHVLESHGLDADWVFGTTLFPFRAHCWLTIGGTLLGDTVERVADYEILHIVPARHS